MMAHAQVEVLSETQLTVSDGAHTPLWLNANKYGLSSLDTNNGYVRTGIFHRQEADSSHSWRLGYGADLALAHHFSSNVVLQQAYVDLGWKKWLLTVGSKQHPLELKNQELSTGGQSLGVNARPVAAVRLSMPQYVDIPGTKGWIGVKGHLSYGWTTDDGWQKDFTGQQSRFTEHTMLHTKAGYIRIGREDKPLSVELGLEMGCQFGGTSYVPLPSGLNEIKSKSDFSSFLNALIPAGSDATDNDYHNKEGNHLGSWLMRVNYDKPAWGVSLYTDHYFEDQSQMFFLDYDGYGSGDDWDSWKHFNWFVYDMSDMQIGLELRLKQFPWLNGVVAEYLHTTYQSGPIYHDHTRIMSDHLGGSDDYYNHFLYTGWQHWGQVMGNPLYRSPLYNANHTVAVADNRFTAWHVAASGNPLPGLHYRLMCTWQRGLGTYSIPFEKPQRNTSLLAEASYTFGNRSSLRGWGVKCGVGVDRGSLLGDNVGAQFTVMHKMTFKNGK